MGYLRVIYVIDDLEHPSKDYNRSIENFPLEIGKYRLKKHPLFSFEILKYKHNILTFSVKNRLHEVKVNQYVFFTYKKTRKKKIDVFFEIMDEEWVDEPSKEEAKEQELSPSLESVPDAVIQVHSITSNRDIYSESTKEEDFELPVMKGANKHLSTIEGDLIVERIVSEDEIHMSVTGHWGKDFVVTSNKEGVFEARDSYGYNDNFRAFSIKLVAKLVKK